MTKPAVLMIVFAQTIGAIQERNFLIRLTKTPINMKPALPKIFPSNDLKTIF